MRKAVSGQGLSEYGMIAALVCLASVGALVLLGGNLRDVFSNMLPERSQTQVTATAPSFTTGSGQTPNSASPKTSPLADMQPLTITMANGKTITIDAYPKNLAKTVETLGTNGTTAILADNLSAMADQLLTAGEITPEEANLFHQLANQGHRIASIEKLFEDAATKSGSDKQAFLNLPIVFDDKTYATPLELVDSIGYNKKLGSGEWVPDGNESAKLLNLQKQLVDSGALNDPAIKDIVNDLVYVINETSDHFQNNVYAIDETSLAPKDMQKQIASDIQESDLASYLTDNTSADICKTGKGKDTGKKCSG